jgi:hypothetical protein
MKKNPIRKSLLYPSLSLFLTISTIFIALGLPAAPVQAADIKNTPPVNGNGNGNGNGNSQPYTGPSLLKNFGRDVMKKPITNAEKQAAAFAAKLLREQTKETNKGKMKAARCPPDVLAISPSLTAAAAIPQHRRSPSSAAAPARQRQAMPL